MYLSLQPQSWRKLKWEQVAPFNENDLIMFLSPNLALVISGIRNSAGENLEFSIKNIMQHEKYKTVFACNDFSKALDNFAEIMDARLERYFITKKAKYIFFDEEEQSTLRRIVREFSLTCKVTIHRRRKDTLTFEPRPMQLITSDEWAKIGSKISKAGVYCISTPDEYMRMSGRKRYPGRGILEREREQLRKIFEMFPDLNQHDLNQLKKAYREYAKKYHPDLNQGDESANQLYLKLQEAMAFIENTRWYKDLK